MFHWKIVIVLVYQNKIFEFEDCRIKTLFLYKLKLEKANEAENHTKYSFEFEKKIGSNLRFNFKDKRNLSVLLYKMFSSRYGQTKRNFKLSFKIDFSDQFLFFEMDLIKYEYVHFDNLTQSFIIKTNFFFNNYF